MLVEPLVALAVTGLGLAWGLDRVGRRAPRLPTSPLPCVVLGARVSPDSRPSRLLAERVARGVELLRVGAASRLVFSGGSPDGRAAEAEVMRALALELGAPDALLTLEAASKSTVQNAQACAEFFRAEQASAAGWEVLLVTSDFHLARATALFRQAGFVVRPVAARHLTLSRRRRLTLTLFEVANLGWRPWLWGRALRPG